MLFSLRDLNEKDKKALLQVIISAGILVFLYVVNVNFILKVILYVGAYLIVGGPVISKAIRNIMKGDFFDENFLMTIATIGALAIKQFPEAVAVMLFYRIGDFFQDMAVSQSKKSITSLLDLRPDYANLKLKEGSFEKIAPSEVNVGATIIVHPGERVPLDGIVLTGSSYLDTSALTGETKPRLVEKRQEVLSGSIVKNSTLELKVTKAFGESTVSKILQLVEEASEKKAVTENFITRFSKIYTPVVVIVAMMLAIGVPLLLGQPFVPWIYRACVFLVIACPCALVLSIPLGFFGGIGASSRAGVLVKGSNYLEALTKVKKIVYDKTGTLTQGKFSVTQIVPALNHTEDEVLLLAALAEQTSPHPIARSIVQHFSGNIKEYQIDNDKELVGLGVQVDYKDKTISVGNVKLLTGLKIVPPKLDIAATMAYVVYGNEYIGALAIADTLKPDSKEALLQASELGVTEQVMLTGDSAIVGQQIADELGITVKSELLPQDKVTEVEKLKDTLAPGEKLAFVGDGLNDTPVLAQADIGIAMGALGSDAAIEAADIVLMSDEPSAIPHVIKIARRTKKIVWENIIFALGIKVIFLTLGVIGIATMWEAVFADVGVTLIAVMNALRLVRAHKDKVYPPKQKFA